MTENFQKRLEVSNFSIKKFSLSVVVVTVSSRSTELGRCLEALQRQSVNSFEVIVVENGSENFKNEMAGELSLTLLKLKKNYGQMIARNEGARLASADIVCFVDDDAIPGVQFVESHIKAHRNSNVIAVRGRILPTTQRSINSLVKGCFDLGNEVKPALLNAEGNMSIKKEIFLKVGGFRNIPFHEGIELTYRLIKEGFPQDSIIYFPDAVVYHDYFPRSSLRLLSKNFFGGMFLCELQRLYPEIFEFISSYEEERRKEKRETDGGYAHKIFNRFYFLSFFSIPSKAGFAYKNLFLRKGLEGEIMRRLDGTFK
jgi:glycosyltransferase involved in cell wall biosynthesis